MNLCFFISVNEQEQYEEAVKYKKKLFEKYFNGIFKRRFHLQKEIPNTIKDIGILKYKNKAYYFKNRYIQKAKT